jgi:SAM-dependent methyltransferase
MPAAMPSDSSRRSDIGPPPAAQPAWRAASEALRRAAFAYHRRAISTPRIGRVASALARQLGTARSLLDVGCGDGHVGRALAERVGAERVGGVDVLVQPAPAIDVTPYDGVRLPFEDGAFEVVVLSDVLHHSADPERLMREALRVASRVVAVKDHVRFGPVSAFVLLALDRVGNAEAGVEVRGRYLSLPEWVELVTRAGGRVTSLEWPLRIHAAPFRWFAPDALQFAARVERAT